MNSIYYPLDKKVLERWVQLVRSANRSLRLKLPVTNDHWYEKVIDCLEITRLAYCNDDIHCKASLLFYYIAKGHKVTDGNKRSAILIVFLFYLVNGYFLGKHNEIKKQAKRVAASHGSKYKDMYIAELEEMFRRVTVVIPKDTVVN